MKSGRKRTLIPKVKNDKGETITSRKGIVNVFGEFYMPKISLESYQNRKTSCERRWKNEIPEFTQDEAYKLPLIASEKVKQVTTTESGPKTSRHATKRRKK